MAKKLNIALIDDFFYPMVDGVANVVKNYATILAKNHNVTVFTSMPLIPVGKEKFPFKVIRCKSHRHIHWSDYSAPAPQRDPAFLKVLNQKFDIIHIHTPITIGHLGVKIAQKYNIPIVATWHTQYHLELKQHFKFRFLAKIGMKSYIVPCFNACDELWVMNKGVEKMARRFGYTGNVYHITNACEFYPVDIDSKRLETFRKQFAEPREKILLYVGRISKLKNLKFVLQVCQKLDYLHFPFKMIFVGRGEDQPYLTKLSEKLGLQDSVIFAGEVNGREKLSYYYQIADLLMFPSLYDTDSIAKIEAAAFGLPTIFAENSLNSFAVKDGYNGYVAPTRATAFAFRLINIFRRPKQYEEVRKNVKVTLYKTWPNVVHQAEQRYYQIIKEHKNKNY